MLQVFTCLSEVLEVQQLLGDDLLLLAGHGSPGVCLGPAGPPPVLLGGCTDHATWASIQMSHEQGFYRILSPCLIQLPHMKVSCI